MIQFSVVLLKGNIVLAYRTTNLSFIDRLNLCVLWVTNTWVWFVHYKLFTSFAALEKECYRHDEKAPHVPPNKKFDKHKHTSTKGIQGYKNSCYLDATLYGMFTFSDAFDVLLRGEITANPEDLRLQKMLKSDIVYPLRKWD